MCKFSERIHNCDHYHKFCDSCAETKKIKTICIFENKTYSQSTKILHCDFQKCDKKISFKRDKSNSLLIALIIIVAR